MTNAAKFGPKDGGSYLSRARERWGEALPDWIEVLARAADSAVSQSELGTRLGLPASSISAVIGNTYPGKTSAIEARVRGVLLKLRVDCPVMGAIARNVCMDLQKQPFSGASPARAKLYGACRKCPNFLGGK